MNQSINSKIITDKDKIKVIHLYEEKQLKIRKDIINISIFFTFMKRLKRNS